MAATGDVLRREIAQLSADATLEALQLVRDLLRHDVSDRRWAAQVGPALSRSDTARLLGVAEGDVDAVPGLVGLRQRNGERVYPVSQFDGRRVLAGLDQVLNVLSGSVTPTGALAWLTGESLALAGRSPLQALRDGDLPAVLLAARRLAGSSH